MNFIQDVIDFHEKFGLTYNGPPRVLPPKLEAFRRKFLWEEAEEYSLASIHASSHLIINELKKEQYHPVHQLEDMLDALVDLMYVTLGTAYLHGFFQRVLAGGDMVKIFEEAWRRVHEANMKKRRATQASDSKRGYSHDVIKPPGWTPPSHLDLVCICNQPNCICERPKR